MYYDVAYANIKVINLLDKLLKFFRINKINSSLYNYIQYYFVTNISPYIDVKIQSYFCN